MQQLPRHLATRVLTIVCAALALSGCGGGEVPPRAVARAAPSDDTTSTSARPAARSSGGVLVDVAGHVRRPGVYRLETGARAHEAIAAAGGARSGADLASINRAAPLVDGQQLLVPVAAAPGASGASAMGGPSASGATVSINSADAAELDALPGIGEVTAQRIVADRSANGPFASVDDLDRVPGIGPATIEALREAARA